MRAKLPVTRLASTLNHSLAAGIVFGGDLSNRFTRAVVGGCSGIFSFATASDGRVGSTTRKPSWAQLDEVYTYLKFRDDHMKYSRDTNLERLGQATSTVLDGGNVSCVLKCTRVIVSIPRCQVAQKIL